MKSSLSMFRLKNEVTYVEKMEENAKNSIIDEDLRSNFSAFKDELFKVFELLREV